MYNLQIILITIICFSKESLTFHHTDETEETFLTDEKQNLFDQNEHARVSPHYPDPAEDYNDIDFTRENIDRVSLKEAALSKTSTSKTTPALSALTLLGFLYFLGYIQDVLQGSNVRKKREADIMDGPDHVESYLQSIEKAMNGLEKFVPMEFSNENFRRKKESLPTEIFVKDSETFVPENSRTSKSEEKHSDEQMIVKSAKDKTEAGVVGRGLEERADKIVAFFGNILGKIPRIFGFNKKATARNDYDISNVQSDTADPGFWSMFGSKVGQIATLMDFLGDPSPTRIGKRNREEERDDDVDDQLIAQPSELNAEDRNFLAPYEDNEDPYLIRRKRFTDGMNAWYSEAASKRSASTDGIGAEGQILKLVFNLFKDAITS